jgi:hypothetical protein
LSTIPQNNAVQGKAGAYAGTKSTGDAADLPTSAMKKRRFTLPWRRSTAAGGRGMKVSRSGGCLKVINRISTKCTARVLPYRPNRATPENRRSLAAANRQPTDSRQSVNSAPPAIKRRRAGTSGGVEGGELAALTILRVSLQRLSRTRPKNPNRLHSGSQNARTWTSLGQCMGVLPTLRQREDVAISNNSPVADFLCGSCSEFELKSEGKFGAKISRRPQNKM